MKKTYQQIGTEIGSLVEQKNAAYGSSFAKAGQFLRLLYPHGIQPEQMADALLLVRIFDKQMRIATDRDALGESPYQDIAGYGILGAFMHQPEGDIAPCHNGCANDAEPSSTTTVDSASHPNAANLKTTTTESERSGFSTEGILSKASPSTFASTGVPVGHATSDASRSQIEELSDCRRAELRWLGHNHNSRNTCAYCGTLHGFEGIYLRTNESGLWFNSEGCKTAFLEDLVKC